MFIKAYVAFETKAVNFCAIFNYRTRYLYTWSKNDVISSVRKHLLCFRGRVIELGLG